MEQHEDDRTRRADADMLDPFKTGVDGVVAQLADRFVRGQANVQLVSGRHYFKQIGSQ